MDIPLQISFHGVERSEALASTVHEKAHGLARYYDQIDSCRVTVEVAGRHHHRGKQFIVRIDIKVPGSEIVVTHPHDADPQVAVHDAFDAVRRKLEDYARERRGDVKRRS